MKCDHTRISLRHYYSNVTCYYLRSNKLYHAFTNKTYSNSKSWKQVFKDLWLLSLVCCYIQVTHQIKLFLLPILYLPACHLPLLQSWLQFHMSAQFICHWDVRQAEALRKKYIYKIGGSGSESYVFLNFLHNLTGWKRFTKTASKSQFLSGWKIVLGGRKSYGKSKKIHY